VGWGCRWWGGGGAYLRRQDLHHREILHTPLLDVAGDMKWEQGLWVRDKCQKSSAFGRPQVSGS
jgi:hypothetical protein